jgi:transcription termination factor 2
VEDRRSRVVLIYSAVQISFIVRFVKARRISWIGHVERMEDSRMPKRVMREQIYTRRKRGRPKVRWLDDVQEDLGEMGIEGWRRKAQDKDQRRRIAQEAKAHVGL